MALHPPQRREIGPGQRQQAVADRYRHPVDDGEAGDRAEGIVGLDHAADHAVGDGQDREIDRPTRHRPHHPGKVGGRHQASLGIQGASGEFAVGARGALVGNAGHACSWDWDTNEAAPSDSEGAAGSLVLRSF